MATVKGDVHDIGKNIVGVVLGCNNYEVIDLGVMVPAEKIIETAKKEQVDIIGLSGLITPSLDEMVYVAQEMERENLSIPLLIGGATTSKIHTAVKIEQNYTKGPTVHVLDASRSVTVAESLLTHKKEEFVRGIKEEYERMRLHHANNQREKEFVPISEARKNKLKLNFSPNEISKPIFTGVKVFKNYPLEELVKYIDWTPFFQTWELAGRYPNILQDEVVGKEATKVFEDAQRMLQKIVSEQWLQANAVIGIWPANSVNEDDIEIYSPENPEQTIAISRTLRQQTKKADGVPQLALADFITPKTKQIKDYVGGFAVTTGIGMEKYIEQFKKDHDDYNSIMLKALADRLAEAFAERMHEVVRKELWGYASKEHLNNDELIKEKYQGIRPAPGYPACPDHTEKTTLFKLLNATHNTGIELTENLAMYPAASVSGWYFAHPQSKYFGLGKIKMDQVEDYAHRKNITVQEAKKWLSPSLE